MSCTIYFLVFHDGTIELSTNMLCQFQGVVIHCPAFFILQDERKLLKELFLLRWLRDVGQ